MDPYKEFVKLMLPVEVRESFELVKVDITTYPSDTKTDELGEMHIYLDEDNRTPDNRTDLTPNGFFPAIKQMLQSFSFMGKEFPDFHFQIHTFLLKCRLAGFPSSRFYRHSLWFLESASR